MVLLRGVDSHGFKLFPTSSHSNAMPTAEPNPRIVPVILSGGAGTRLWPLSRETAPKPSMPLPDGETLLAKTAARALALPGVERARHRHQPRVLLPHARRVRRVARRSGRSAHRSCSSRSVATRHLLSRSPRFGPNRRTATDAVLLVLPADHLVRDQARFRGGCRASRAPRAVGQAGDVRHPSGAPRDGLWLHRVRRCAGQDDAAARSPRADSSRSRRSRRRANTWSPATTSGTPGCSASRRPRSSRLSSAMRRMFSTRCDPIAQALADKNERIDARNRR